MKQDPRSDVLITAQELHSPPEPVEQGARYRPPVLLDVRWALPPKGQTYDGRTPYQNGHIPGAVFVDLEAELSGPASPAMGRHPLPSTRKFQAAARRWGIAEDSWVVCYDDSGGVAAARAWWLLNYYGVDAYLLDGGFNSWQRANYPIETGDVIPPPGDVDLSPGHMPIIDADETAALAESGTGVLLDARAPERYRGEIEPIDPRAGHIPGATNVPTAANLTPEGTFRSAAELRKIYYNAGVDDTSTPEVGVYCGSGVTAAHNIAALATLGVKAALYPGSWSQWSADPARPAATTEPNPGLVSTRA